MGAAVSPLPAIHPHGSTVQGLGAQCGSSPSANTSAPLPIPSIASCNSLESSLGEADSIPHGGERGAS